MKRAENEVSGFRRRDGERDGFQIAHLADHDHIGIFPERSAQRRAEGARVGVHFALCDMAAFWFENIFDRVLERDDVFAPLDVHLLDQRRERGRFAAAHGTGHEDEAVLVTGQQFQAFGQTQFVHCPHLGVDDPENEIDPEPLSHDAGPEPAGRIRVGEVRVAALVELDLLRAGQETLGQRRGLMTG